MQPASFPDEGSIAVHAEERNGVVRLRLEGEFDLASEDMVERALSEASRAASIEVIIDLSGLAFMDSTGLSVLLRAQQRSESAGAASIRTVGARGPVARLLKVSGVEQALLGKDAGRPGEPEAEWQPLASRS